MNTEFNSVTWWDLRNGQETSNNNSSSLYGWRQYGDYGVATAPILPARLTPIQPFTSKGCCNTSPAAATDS